MDVLSFVLALVPILWLVVVLLVFRWPAWRAAAGSLVLSCVLAALWWHLGALEVATAVAEGFLMALWPIVIVIIAAVFTYNLCVRTGAMDVIGRMITSVSADRRILALLIAWCFGGFMEGMAGFGTAVAIPAGMLAALGYPPLSAVLMCLLANGVPTPYGSIGIPTVSLADLVGLDAADLAFTQMVQLAPFFIVAPVLIVLVAGKDVPGSGVAQRLRGVIGVALAAGVSFTVPALAVAALVGPELTVVVGSICSLGVTAALGRAVERRGALDEAYRLGTGESAEAGPSAGAPESAPTGSQTSSPVDAPAAPLTLGAALRAWSCFILIFLLLLGTSKLVAPVNAALAPLSTTLTVYSGPNPGSLSFSWVNTPGVLIMVAALVGGAIQGATPRVMGEVLAATVKQMLPTVATMLAVLGCAKVMGYAGMISSISAFCIAVAGGLYPLLAPWVGAVGTFVTGSGTSSGMLFGQVQAQAAEALGADPVWTVGLNSLGVAAGKMLSPQTLAIGLAAVRVRGKDAELLRAVAPYALGFLVVMSIIGMAGSALPLW
ncbi:L-lactate permease [Collinsella intestinalis]|uniref:L-lactate permease n=1 Tax=Collinsella intestinalis TaxID=147207 RepID=UPI0019565F3B|nr:L-lactate permease [Collinsella intestinalis]MBM6943417.1 L-lactate permease [Collinsella intestinalis]